MLYYTLLSFPFILLINRRIAKVMAIHSGKKGVNGPAQNARYAVAITLHHFQPNIAWHKYPPQTGEYITMTTKIKITMVCQSLHSFHTHLQKLINFVFSFIKKSLIFSAFLYFLLNNCIYYFQNPHISKSKHSKSAILSQSLSRRILSTCCALYSSSNVL